MADYIIATDNTADLPESYMQENGIACTYLSYTMDGKSYNYPDFLPESEFYSKVRAGSMPTTAQVNPDQGKELYRKYLDQGLDVLYIAFSSGLSGTYNSMRIAADEIREEYPDRKLIVIDSLCASLGEGLLVHYAMLLKKQGKSIDEVAEWLSNHHADIAVLAVPAVNAQKIADMLTDAGIHSIWNFAPVDLKVPDDVVSNHVHLSDSLHILTYRMNEEALFAEIDRNAKG